MLKRIGKRKQENYKKSTFFNIASQLTSYCACACVTMILYGLRLYQYVNAERASNNQFVFLKASIDGIPILIYIIIGIAITIFLIFFFIHFSKGESYKNLIIKFLLIKKREEQREIGRCWTNGNCDVDEDSALLKKISDSVDKYL